MQGEFIINGVAKNLIFDSRAVLVDVLRENGYTEVKEGCKTGECGACLILLDGELMNSCQILAASVVGREITTVRGIGSRHEPHPIQ
ncbi:(2Fe-2S)-binding protein, partial [bacterium]